MSHYIIQRTTTRKQKQYPRYSKPLQLCVTDPSGTFITHTWLLFPVINNCVCVSLVHHRPVDYRFNVRWGVWVSVLCVLAFVPLWIAQMIMGLVLCVNHCVLLLIISGTPRSFVLVFYPVFCIVFVWSSSPCLYTAHCNLGVIKKNSHIPAPVSQIIHTNVTLCYLSWRQMTWMIVLAC